MNKKFHQKNKYAIIFVLKIQKNSLKEIWHGQRFSEIREKHLKNQRKTCYPCDRCPIGE